MSPSTLFSISRHQNRLPRPGSLLTPSSPYDNVAALPYPPIFAVAGLTDPRVTYWEPAKWVAKLRDNSTSGNPVLFKINLDAGHAGASGRFSRLHDIACNYAFALKMTGHADTTPKS